MAPASKGKVGLDHVRAFNVAVAEWKSQKSEKILAEVDKILAVLCKISDLSVFSSKKPEVLSLMVNCQLLVSSLDHKTATTWTVISLLTSICSTDRTLCQMLRDRICLLPVCSKLLHSIPSTTQARTLKLLGLMKLVGEGVKINRREAWLSSCISDLVSFLSSPDLSSPSLFLLCCLCQGNYIATKMVISSLPPATLTSLITAPSTDPADQLTSEILLYYMSKYQLARLPLSHSKVQSYLPLLLDVFCSSYSSDDISLMSLIISFLSSLSADQDLKTLLSQQDCLPHLQQLLVTHDFSDGFCVLSASLFFTFLTALVTTYSCDYVATYDQTLKVILVRLDSKPSTGLSSALNFMIQLLKKIDFPSLPDAVARNIKFQVDQLLPSLMSLFVDCTKSTSFKSSGGKTVKQEATTVQLEPEMFQSLLKCLALLETISLVDLEGWRQSVAVNVKASKMKLAYVSSCQALTEQQERSSLTVEFLSLSSLLAEVDDSWNKVESELMADQDRVNLVSSFVRMEKTDCPTFKKALRLLNKVDFPEVMYDPTPLSDETGGVAEEFELPGETMGKIENLMEDVQSSLGKMQLDEVVVEVLQLSDRRRGAERSHTSHLMAALSAADERLAAQRIALVEREEEVRSLERITNRLLAGLGATKEELEDMRSQHGELSREADITRDRLGRELDDLQGQVELLTEEKENITEKVVKYKNQVVSLTKDLEQYQENQDQLEKKLKLELKIKEEVSVKLTKKEDKLRKKERQLEEEMTAREKAEKEVDNLRKECSSLETLSKRYEQALAKKEKQLHDSEEEIKEMKKIQDAIFNLSKTRNSSSAAC